MPFVEVAAGLHDAIRSILNHGFSPHLASTGLHCLVADVPMHVRVVYYDYVTKEQPYVTQILAAHGCQSTALQDRYSHTQLDLSSLSL